MMPNIKFLLLFTTLLLEGIKTQEGPKTLYNLPPLPDDERINFLNEPSTTHKTTVLNRKTPTLPPLFSQPLSPLLRFPLPQVPLFDPYNEANMKSELPPLPEESLKGYFDSDGMFVPKQYDVINNNSTKAVPKNQMAGAATFVSIDDGNKTKTNTTTEGEDIPENIFLEPIKKNRMNEHFEKDSLEKDFVIARSNLFIDGFNEDTLDDEDMGPTESPVMVNVTPKIIENHGDLSITTPTTDQIVGKENFNNNLSKIPPSTTDVTLAPIGMETEFKKTFENNNFNSQSIKQQFIRTTLSPKLVLRNEIKNMEPININNRPRYIPKFMKKNNNNNNNNNNNFKSNNFNNIRQQAFVKKRPNSNQQFDLPLPANNNINSNDKNSRTETNKENNLKNNNNFRGNNPRNNNRPKSNVTKNGQQTPIRIIHRGKQNTPPPPPPPVPNPNVPKEKKKSKFPGQLDLPSLVALPTPSVDGFSSSNQNGRKFNNNVVKNTNIVQRFNSVPKTIVQTSQMDIKNPTDSMFTNDVDWFDWDMYKNGRTLGHLPPNLINDPLLPKPQEPTIPLNGRHPPPPPPPRAVNPNNFVSRSIWPLLSNNNQEMPRASGTQQLPLQVQKDDEIPTDSFIVNNAPQLELNLPGYGKQQTLQQLKPSVRYPAEGENLVPFENTNTGRVSTTQLTTGSPYNNLNANNYNNGNFYNNNNYQRQYNQQNNRWNNNNQNTNYNNNYNNNYNRNYDTNQQPSLFNLFNFNPLGGFNLFG
uniref:Protein Wnt n=1 Tax=Parastrongyloides trichosuri TaxID=131310 RepID=A0A0N4Z6T6_PARTI